MTRDTIADALDLAAIPAIDTHCHPFPPEQDVVSPQHLLNSVCVTLTGNAPALNESALLARRVAKDLARLLGCEPTWEAAVAARNEAVACGAAAYHQRLFADANIAMLLIDPGFPLDRVITSQDFAAVLPCPVLEGYRIERYFPYQPPSPDGQRFTCGHRWSSSNRPRPASPSTPNPWASSSSNQAPSPDGQPSFANFIDGFTARLKEEASRPETRFFKTVIAYYTGLAIEKVSVDEACRAWDERAAPGDAADKTVRDYLFWLTALAAREHGLPVQVHTGHTSRMMTWDKVNPILMTPILNETELSDVQFVLVHGGYPYCAEAGYMTSSYPNVALDLSLMIPWASIGAARCIEETLEFAPTAKVMYGSDGIRTPELYWIGAHIARGALARVLGRLMDDEILDREEAREVAQDILHRNAERIYGVTIAARDSSLAGVA